MRKRKGKIKKVKQYVLLIWCLCLVVGCSEADNESADMKMVEGVAGEGKDGNCSMSGVDKGTVLDKYANEKILHELFAKELTRELKYYRKARGIKITQSGGDRGALLEKKSDKGVHSDNFSRRDTIDGAVYRVGTQLSDSTALGGYGRSDNIHKKIPDNLLTDEGLYLLAEPSVVTVVGVDNDGLEIRGMRVSLFNPTALIGVFNAVDSKLDIVQEAKNKDGEFQNIERIQSSRCGNSYHRVFLPSESYWVLSTKRFQGEFQTQLRFKLSFEDGEKIRVIYSNIFNGSINLGQFRLAKKYRPTTIDDLKELYRK